MIPIHREPIYFNLRIGTHDLRKICTFIIREGRILKKPMCNKKIERLITIYAIPHVVINAPYYNVQLKLLPVGESEKMWCSCDTL
jgi:hypothetical protein